jgi:hypothetical protein
LAGRKEQNVEGFRTWLRSSVADPEVTSGVEVRHASKYVFVRRARNIDGEELMFTPKSGKSSCTARPWASATGPPVEPADDVIDAVSAWTSAL